MKSLNFILATIDYAFVDATFFEDGKTPRPMSEVPHSFIEESVTRFKSCLLYTSPSPRDRTRSRMPSSA